MLRLKDEAAWEAMTRERNTRFERADQPTKADACAVPRTSHDAASSGPITLPWPPSGNTAVRHAKGVHYLRPEVLAYRDSVAALCARFKPVTGAYRLHVHLSPPDARARDMDNALKSLNDALVKAGYIESDAMSHMRMLVVTCDSERQGRAVVLAEAI